jgi:hypothetical protein
MEQTSNTSMRIPTALRDDASYANTAASVRQSTQVSLADAHIGAAIQATSADRISVITSDPADMRRMARDRDVTVVTI